MELVEIFASTNEQKPQIWYLTEYLVDQTQEI